MRVSALVFPISTPLLPNSPQTRRHIAKSRVRTIIESIFKSRYTELAILVFSVSILLLGKDQSSITETAVAANVPSSQIADIGSIFVDTSRGGPVQSPTSTVTATAMQGSAMIAQNPPDTTYLDGFKAYQLIKYTVQPGDTIGAIATNFGVSINTIVWANNLKSANSLSLGQTLKIPPVTGVIHTVQKGDTIAAIAKKYKADTAKILAFNNLEDDQALQIGGELMVPGGELSGIGISIKTIARSASRGSGIYVPVGDGQCVALVQAHGFSNMHGNAYTWKRYINTPAPVVGGVAVLRGGRYGHVALVTAVKPNSIQIVEQNYYGRYIIDHREISLNDGSIVGFIK